MHNLFDIYFCCNQLDEQLSYVDTNISIVFVVPETFFAKLHHSLHLAMSLNHAWFKYIAN